MMNKKKREPLRSKKIWETSTKITEISDKNSDLVTYLYLYFYPYLMIYRSLIITSSMNGHSIVLPNTIIKYTDSVDKGSLLFTTPNINLVYGFLWLNVEMSPAVISVPSIGIGRYFNIQIIDCMNQVIGYQGIRNVGVNGGTYMVTKNNSREFFPELSQNLRRIYTSSTNLVLCIITVQLLNVNDMYIATTFLKSFGVTSPTPNAFIGQVIPSKPRPNTVLGINFSKYIEEGVRNKWFVPPLNILNSLNKIKSYDRNVIIDGIERAHKLIRDKMGDLTAYSSPELQKIFYIGNWKMGEGKYTGAFPTINKIDELKSRIGSTSSNPLLPGKTDVTYLTSVLTRALSVRLGTFGAIPEDSIYIYTFFDNDGNYLDSDYNYQIIMEKEPPVEAFWMLNIYTIDNSQFLFPSESTNFSINSSNVNKNADGSVQIFIWPMRPMNFGNQPINWIPATFGKPFFVFLGLYLPQVEQIYKWTTPIINRMDKAISLPKVKV